MAYVKNTWSSGDVLTADKLNRIEEGIAASSEQTDTINNRIIDDSVTNETQLITASYMQNHYYKEADNNLFAGNLTIGTQTTGNDSTTYSGTSTLNTTTNIIHGSTTIDELAVTKFTSIPSYSSSENRHYAVQLNNSSGALYVNVPWTDTIYSAGDGLTLNNNNQFSLNYASANQVGGIKIGNNLSINTNGVLSATDTTYSAGNGLTLNNNNKQFSLNYASTDTVGGIKVGNNLSIDANGVLSAIDTNTTYSTATVTDAGLMSAGDKVQLEELINNSIRIPEDSNIETGSYYNYILNIYKLQNTINYTWENIRMPNMPNTQGEYQYTLQMTINVDSNNGKTINYAWVENSNGGE